MLDYCNDHRTDSDGNLIINNSKMTLKQASEIVDDKQIGECPVCTGKIPSIPSTEL